MDNENTNIIELLDENDNAVLFEHIMTLDYGEKEYVVLSPVNNNKSEGDNNAEDSDDHNDEDEVVILRVEYDENGDDYYVSIDDEDELEDVFAAVNEIYSGNIEEES